jgi:hypothetical protein
MVYIIFQKSFGIYNKIIIFVKKSTMSKNLTREQELLRKLYECQDEMEKLLKDGKDDKHYKMICDLIKRLEIFLCDSQDLM